MFGEGGGTGICSDSFRFSTNERTLVHQSGLSADRLSVLVVLVPKLVTVLAILVGKTTWNAPARTKKINAMMRDDLAAIIST